MSVKRFVSKSIRSYSTEAVASASASASTSASSTLSTSPSTSTSNPSSLQIKNPKMRNAILNGSWIDGPPSLRTKRARLAYIPPKGLNEVFPLAYDIILKEKENHYKKAEEIENQLKNSQGKNEEEISKLESLLNKHLVRAELNDPEVQYNYRIKQLDLEQPVYRHLAERDWKSYDMLISLQRLEQLHVIPDTLPTINPRADIKIQFPTVINKWVTPGEVIRNSICSRAPIVKIQEFEKIAPNSLYTILIVDPDTPDIENDSYKTTLHWAVTNIPLSNTNHEVDITKSNELIPFLPPHPEKNGPTHRYCVWAFRQSTTSTLSPNDISLKRDNFNIRNFVSTNNLDPVAAHVWRCSYDQSTESVLETFGLGPGTVFEKIRR